MSGAGTGASSEVHVMQNTIAHISVLVSDGSLSVILLMQWPL